MGPPKLIRYGVRMNYVGQTLKCTGSLSLFIAGALGIELGGKDTIRVVFEAVAMDGTYASPGTIEQGFVYIAKVWSWTLPLASRLSPPASRLSPPASRLSPLASRHLPPTSHISRPHSHVSPLPMCPKFNAAVMLIWSTLPTQADMLNDAKQDPKPKAKTKKETKQEAKQEAKLKRGSDPKARPTATSRAKQKAKTKGKGKGKAKEQ